jgi:hypothetical protein
MDEPRDLPRTGRGRRRRPNRASGGRPLRRRTAFTRGPRRVGPTTVSQKPRAEQAFQVHDAAADGSVAFSSKRARRVRAMLTKRLARRRTSGSTAAFAVASSDGGSRAPLTRTLCATLGRRRAGASRGPRCVVRLGPPRRTARRGGRRALRRQRWRLPWRRSRRDHQRPVQGRGESPPGSMAIPRSCRVRPPGVGGMVQQPPPARAHRQRASRRGGGTPPCPGRGVIPDGETTGSDVNGFGSEPCDSQFLIKGGSDDGRNHALGPVGG